MSDYEKANSLLLSARDEINKITETYHGEGIEYWSSCSLDEAISDIIQAKTLMMLAEHKSLTLTLNKPN